MYARVFRVVDADGFTRDYLSQQGISLAPAEPIPTDPYSLRMAQKKRESAGRNWLCEGRAYRLR